MKNIDKTIILSKPENNFFYVLCILRFAIGKYKLTINYQGKNLVDNYDFTKYNFGHGSYDMKILAKKIAGAYKEI